MSTEEYCVKCGRPKKIYPQDNHVCIMCREQNEETTQPKEMFIEGENLFDIRNYKA